MSFFAVVWLTIAGAGLTIAIALLWLENEDRRFARCEERERQRKIDRALRNRVQER